MVAYYEGATEYPSSNLLPQLAQALGVRIDELPGTEPCEAGQARHTTFIDDAHEVVLAGS